MDYEEEMGIVTNDFFKEWDKMNQTKDQLYEKLRNKLVNKYPSYRKKYRDHEVFHEEYGVRTKNSSYRGSSAMHSNRLSITHIKSEPSEVNNLTVTQVKQLGAQQEENKDKRMLKDIFRQAYIWSDARGKHLNETYQKSTVKNVQEEKQVRNIKKNLTFMNYINKKTWKKGINRTKIKGSYMSKHK